MAWANVSYFSFANKNTRPSKANKQCRLPSCSEGLVPPCYMPQPWCKPPGTQEHLQIPGREAAMSREVPHLSSGLTQHVRTQKLFPVALGSWRRDLQKSSSDSIVIIAGVNAYRALPAHLRSLVMLQAAPGLGCCECLRISQTQSLRLRGVT